MLKYEEKLHLDVCYKKLQQGNHWFKEMISLVMYMIVYIVLFYLLRKAMSIVPDQCAWSHSKEIMVLSGISITRMDFVYLIGGLVGISYGSFRLSRITILNHSVRDNDTPKHLLTDGYYAKVRHPMYGVFIILYASVFLSMGSRNGLIITTLLIIGQYINAYIEEKKLHNLFQEEFMVYCNKTRAKLLSKVQVAILLIAYLLTIIGFIL